jgi:hypothetical protein
VYPDTGYKISVLTPGDVTSPDAAPPVQLYSCRIMCTRDHVHPYSCTWHAHKHPSLHMISYTGEGNQEGDLRRRITVTLSIFNFSIWFFAQIVVNRSVRLSRPFFGSADIFSKSYDENQIWRGGAGAKRPRGILCGSAAIQICFRHNFSKKNVPRT